jgi:hypothetical protein
MKKNQFLMACARTALLAASALTLLPAQAASVPYLSGGVSGDERADMQGKRADYNLRVLFAVRGSGDYLADVGVTISDRRGGPALDVTSAGPLLYAKLAPGQYRIVATVDGKTLTRQVTIPANGSARELAFYWPDTATQ